VRPVYCFSRRNRNAGRDRRSDVQGVIKAPGRTLHPLFTLIWARIAALFANKATPKTLNRVTGVILVVLGIAVMCFNLLEALLSHMTEMGLSSPERQEGIYFARDLSEIRKIIENQRSNATTTPPENTQGMMQGASRCFNDTLDITSAISSSVPVPPGKAINTSPSSIIVRELGTWIGESGNRLVYGGSKSGLMGEIAESVLQAEIYRNIHRITLLLPSIRAFLSFDKVGSTSTNVNDVVYLGANEGNDPSLRKAVRELGTWIGESGNRLVYGAGIVHLLSGFCFYVSNKFFSYMGQGMIFIPDQCIGASLI